MRIRFVDILIVLCASSGVAQQFPDGPGKDVTIQLCSNCHGSDVIFLHRQGRDEWVSTIQKMIEAGAEGTPEQFSTVLDYLTKNFGPGAPKININKASESDLQSSLGVNEKEAAAVVKYRADKGAFKSVEDVKKVPGLDAKKIESQKDRLIFQ